MFCLGNRFSISIMYFPENGETHHGVGKESPFLIMAGDNCRLDIGGRYVRLPYLGNRGHKTLGNWYTTLLNVYGNSMSHFGALDVGLKNIDQQGPIQQFLA